MASLLYAFAREATGCSDRLIKRVATINTYTIFGIPILYFCKLLVDLKDASKRVATQINLNSNALLENKARPKAFPVTTVQMRTRVVLKL